MQFHLISIFPEIFSSYLNESIIKRARESGQININTVNLRDFTKDKHRSTDDTPYGGGAGMIMTVEPIYKAIKALKLQFPISNSQAKSNPPAGGQNSNKVVLLSAKGKQWNQKLAKEYSKLDNLVMVCGRYEGVDERILNYVEDEISIGDYVLTGGELGALVMIDSITRLLPGVLGNEESAITESHSEPGILEYPQYTKPEVFIDDEGHEHRVPPILLSGNHAEIEKWRKENQKINNCL